MKPLATLAGTAIAAAVITLASCSSSGSTTSTNTGSSGGSSSQAATTGIVIKDFKYSGDMTVKAGTTVTVTNEDSMAHTVTDKGVFDSGNIDGNGATGTFTAPSKAGTYKFGCTYHSNMAGTLTVTG